MLTSHNRGAEKKHACILPTAYLPPIEYMVMLIKASYVRIELHETFPRQTWRNRCRILTANGLLDFSIPVHRPQGNHTKTKDVIVSERTNWQAKHWRAITAAYNKAPFFLYYKDLFAPYFLNRWSGALWQHNNQLLATLMNELSIDTTIGTTGSYQPAPAFEEDYRERITPKTQRREKPVVTHFPPYHQVFGDRFCFTPNASIIDLLFNTGPEATPYLRETVKYANG